MALGVGSSLDVNGLVTQLMAAEQQPLNALATKEAKYRSQLTAYGSLKGALSSLQSSVATLTNPAKFSAVSASIADTTLASVSASSSAMPGSYSINVTQLAQSQKLQSTAFAATSTTIGTGTLNISFGTYTDDLTGFTSSKASKSITIGASQSSLSGVRDAINAANVGISANIINDGTHGNQLVITSTDSGASNALKITVADSSDGSNTDTAGLSQLTYDGTLSSHMTQSAGMGPKDAVLTIDGIEIKKPSNSITDAITGITVNLLKTSTIGVTTNLTVNYDTKAIQSTIQTFVDSYNTLNTTINNLSTYDAANNTASVLTGDSTLQSLKSQLRQVFNAALSTAGGGLTTLSDIGITFQRSGSLALDSTKLNTVLKNPTKDVSTLFAALGKPSDSLIRFDKSTIDSKNGIYAVNVSRLATQGNAVGTAQGSSLAITTDLNDTLTLTVNGKTVTVKLAAGSYTTANNLAAEVQSKINGASVLSSSNTSVTVSATLGGELTIRSNHYGSNSTVSNITGSASTTILGMTDYTNGSGLDAMGTIGSTSATGSGQILTGVSESNKGLSVSILGGTLGDRGTLRFARGYAYNLNNLLTKMLDSNNLIGSRVSGINTSIKEIGKDREQINLHLATIEKRYRTQFTALDQMLSGMSQTSNFLTQQLANLPGSTNKS